MLLNLRIGFYLALRQLRRASLWTTSLIIFIMVLTFLNLVVVSGVLVGLLQGSIDQHRIEYTGDVMVSTLTDKSYIENSPSILSLIKAIPEVESYSARYRETATFEANYKTRKDTDKPNTASAQINGINPEKEDAVSGLASRVVDGEFLAPGDYDQVLLGRYMLSQYVPVESPDFSSLDNVKVGTKIRMTVKGITREVTVKGILKSKVDQVSRGAYMLDTQLRSIIGRNDGNIDFVSLKLKRNADPIMVKQILLRNGVGAYAKVQTYVDAQPQFLKDMIGTFNMLGNAFSSIGLVVASITIFIVVFINALTRRKYIGILKGIGIDARVIEISYVFQSIFYATLGSGIGLAVVYGFLVPFFRANPIDFPFSDGILVAELSTTMFRVGLLVVTTVIAGFIPAWMIIRKNTLDSILGRN